MKRARQPSLGSLVLLSRNQMDFDDALSLLFNSGRAYLDEDALKVKDLLYDEMII